ADRNAAKLDRRAGRESADRFVEDELVGLRITGGWVEGLGPVAEQGEDGVFLGRRQDRISRGRLERDAAYQNRQNRLGLHGETACRERHVDSARVPKAGVQVDVLVVGRLHEHLDGQILAVLVEFVRRDLADLQTSEEDWRA